MNELKPKGSRMIRWLVGPEDWSQKALHEDFHFPVTSSLTELNRNVNVAKRETQWREMDCISYPLSLPQRSEREHLNLFYAKVGRTKLYTYPAVWTSFEISFFFHKTQMIFSNVCLEDCDANASVFSWEQSEEFWLWLL